MTVGYDNNNNDSTTDRSLVQHLWLGAIETLLNSFVDLDQSTRDGITALNGLVVRVKVLDPYLPFYLYFTQEGIEVHDTAPAPAKVRINARLFDLLRTLLGVAAAPTIGRPRVRVWGDAASIATLETLLHDFNLRTKAQIWLRDHVNLDVLRQKIRNHDPGWLQDILPLPGLMRETLGELKQLNQSLQAQQQEFQRYREENRRQRIQDILFMLLAFLALLGGLTGGLSSLSLASMGSERLLLLVMGMVLIVSRLRK